MTPLFNPLPGREGQGHWWIDRQDWYPGDLLDFDGAYYPYAVFGCIQVRAQADHIEVTWDIDHTDPSSIDSVIGYLHAVAPPRPVRLRFAKAAGLARITPSHPRRSRTSGPYRHFKILKSFRKRLFASCRSTLRRLQILKFARRCESGGGPAAWIPAPDHRWSATP